MAISKYFKSEDKYHAVLDTDKTKTACGLVLTSLTPNTSPLKRDVPKLCDTCKTVAGLQHV